jgi:hypothetical protein
MKKVTFGFLNWILFNETGYHFARFAGFYFDKDFT